MALRLKWSPSPSVRFSPAWAPERVRAAAAIAALIGATALLRLRRIPPCQPAAAERNDPGQRHDHRWQLIVAPTEIGSRAESTQEIPQNVEHPEPPIKTTKPLDVTFVIANQTNHPSTVQIHDQSRLVKGIKVGLRRSPGTIQAELPTGHYSISAGGIGGAARPPEGRQVPRLLTERRPAPVTRAVPKKPLQAVFQIPDGV